MTLTKHAKQRMSQRIITLQDIYTAVKCGTPTEAKNNLICYTHGNIYVIINPITNTVITACFIKSYTKQLEQYAKLNNIGFYAAVRQQRRSQIVS
ncbi:MAG TPA: hypothetical protein DEG71_08775 [Clostridiales bacterium]|nr:hypothetical protein [Clostridiales bacterium]